MTRQHHDLLIRRQLHYFTKPHRRSIIFRREAGQTDGLEEAGKTLIGDRASFNGTDMEWSWTDGQSVKRAFIGYDEAGEFLEEQVSSMMAWNRGPSGQRCRVVLASNPPRMSECAWMIEWFALWLDESWPDRAKSGELRCAVMIKGKPVWQAGPEEVEIDGEKYRPLSFTFVPAALSDNPIAIRPNTGHSSIRCLSRCGRSCSRACLR